MPWDIQFNSDTKIIKLIYWDIVTPQELLEAFHEAKQFSAEHNTILFLADCTNMAGGHSVIDLYYLISLYEQNEVRNRLKEAIILPALKSSQEEVQFYETACLNKGFDVKIFKNTDDAMAWLID